MLRPALLAFSFIESAAVVLLERGVYFYTKDVLGFGEALNLGLGVLLGVTYVAGALLSHRLAERLGERRVVTLCLGAHLVLAAVPMAWPSAGVMWALYPGVGLVSGLMWPVVESYVSAGLIGRQMLRAVGRFCIAWSVAVPLAVAVSGPLIDTSWPESIFALTAICHVAAFGLLAGLPARPDHTPDDHPDRPDPDRLARYTALMTGSRWCLIAAYAMMFLLAPLLPEIFTHKLGLTNTQATPLVSLMDWMRVAAFAGFMMMTFWYGRTGPLITCVAALPVGFLLVLFGPSVGWVLAGEVLFGLVSGLIYYASLYYATAAKNAAVEAGGGHEALIGGGFTLGPAAGLAGLGLAGAVGGHDLGLLIGTSPIILLGLLGGALPLLRLARGHHST